MLWGGGGELYRIEHRIEWNFEERQSTRSGWMVGWLKLKIKSDLRQTNGLNILKLINLCVLCRQIGTQCSKFTHIYMQIV